MIFIVIYITGIIAAVLGAIEIFQRTDMKFPAKLGLSMLMVLLSWISALFYFLAGKAMLDLRGRKESI